MHKIVLEIKMSILVVLNTLSIICPNGMYNLELTYNEKNYFCIIFSVTLTQKHTATDTFKN